MAFPPSSSWGPPGTQNPHFPALALRHPHRAWHNPLAMNNLIQQGLALRELLRERILVLDGAMGTMLQQANLTAADFGGAHLEGCNENLVLTRPDVVLSHSPEIFRSGRGHHRDELLRQHADRARGVSAWATAPAKSAAAPRNSRARRPTNSPLRPSRASSPAPWARPRKPSASRAASHSISSAELSRAGARAHRGRRGHAARRNLSGYAQHQSGRPRDSELCREIGQPIPIMISATIEPMGTMLAGQGSRSVLGFARSRRAAFSRPELRHRPGVHDRPHPHASIADEPLRLLLSQRRPAERGRPVPRNADDARRAARALRRSRLAQHRRRLLRHHRRSTSAPSRRWSKASAAHARWTQIIAPFTPASKSIEADESTRPLIVGERTNVIGSRQFKNLVAAEKWEEATEIARRQVKSGAHIVDVCLQSTDRDELKDIPPFYDQLIRKIKAPMMIDTTDARAIELALTYCQGKSIINSINLEDGEEKFERVCPLARAYGAASSSAASTRIPCRRRPSRASANSKSPSARMQLLTGKYGIPRKTSFSIRSCSPAPPATRTTSAARSKPSKAFA